MKENPHNLHREIMLACSRGSARLFRNNTGQGWIGKAEHLGDGSVLIHDARPLHAGLVRGGSDLIGWRSVRVEQHHVGRILALFTAIEAKTGRGHLTAEQRAFIQAVIAAGGLAGEARSVHEAEEILSRG